MCSKDGRCSKPDTSTNDPDDTNTDPNAKSEGSVSDYEPDERWIAKNEKYFRRNNVFAAWQQIDRQTSRTITDHILKLIWSGSSSGKCILRSSGMSAQVIDLSNYDTSRPAGCQYWGLSDLSDLSVTKH